jgi:hypothetical protein
LVNSRLGPSAAAARGSGGEAPPPQAAPLLPRLRGGFAEFLGHGSPDRLGILYPPACVGFGTGACGLPRGFSREHGTTGFASRLRLASRPLRGGVLHGPPAYALSRGRPEPRPAALLRRPVGRGGRRRYRNVRLLGLGYACRPRLSTRLTLGGLASPRKPWACGGRVSRPALATHACILASARSTAGRPCGFAPARNAPLPPARRIARARRFGTMLEPRELSALIHSTSELLRTL